MRQIDIANGHCPPVGALYGSDRRDPPSVSYRQRVQEPERRRRDEGADAGPPPVITYLLTGINVVIFLLMMKVGNGNISEVAEIFGAKVNVLIQHGQWWRLLTPVFLHGSWMHLISNSLSLFWFGSGIERLYGPRKYLLIYFFAGVAGNIASYMHSPALSLGASGAIFGLVGAGLMFPIRFRALLPPDAPSKILGQIVPIAAINLFIGTTTPAIDNWAHMGGLAGGALVALFLIPDALMDRPPRRMADVSLTLVCIGVLAITLLAGLKQWGWARQEQAPPPESNVALKIVPLGTAEDAWWHVGIPTDWKQEEGQSWTSAQGQRLDVMDSTEDPQLIADVQATAQKAKPNIEMGGRPGWKIHVKINNSTSDLFVVPVYNRVVALLFTPGDDTGGPTTPLINQIVHSVHFDHVPVSNPQPPASPAAP